MILVINCPYSDYKHLNINKNSLKKELSKIDKVEFYDTKFSFVKNKKVNFIYEDLLFENIAKDIKNMYGENIYVIGIEHAGTNRKYLVNDEGERKGLYIKNGYKKNRILKQEDSSFDSDMWIMYKEI